MGSGTQDGTADVWPGRHQPLGATWTPEATNFAVHAPEATSVEVCLFDVDAEGHETERRLALPSRTLGIWHGEVPAVRVGQRYGFRADGPWDPDRGRRFNPAKLLLDPYARAVSGEVRHGPELYDHVRPPEDADADEVARCRATRSELDSAPSVPRSVVVHDDHDWGDEPRPRHRWADTVLYELHVKGMTAQHPDVPEDLRGTYAGLAHPSVVQHLVDLGVTTVELLPVHQFLTEPEVAARGLVNYWGYNSIGFFAPHGAYSASGDRGQQVREFKRMVGTFHRAGIEVVLDVVYNHTAEGGRFGPTYSFRGLDDLYYYKRVDPAESEQGRDAYWDVTGCGNTVNVSRTQTLRMVLDSLRYWVTEMHVDGFRFDLTPALTRTWHELDMRSHFLTAIGQDPVLRHVKLVAEPWDASMDGYSVGRFPPPWVEWNDRYRDTMRDFWRGGTAGVRTVATRLAGSSDLYADDGRSPYASVNFVTAHDGFTLRDLVSYDRKHNEANGEEGRDGTDDNRSWNCGAEGPTDDPEVLALRQRQAANIMATLLLSTGVPMLTAGDERGRTQGGNNNAYCLDDPTSWVDWSEDDSWPALHELTRAALRLRREHPALRQRHYLEGRPAAAGRPKDLAWFHPEGREMTEEDWHDDGLRTLGMFVSGDPLRARGRRGEVLRDSSFMTWFNAAAEPVEVLLPDNPWVHVGEVALATDPAYPVGREVRAGERMVLDARCVVVLRQV